MVVDYNNVVVAVKTHSGVNVFIPKSMLRDGLFNAKALSVRRYPVKGSSDIILRFVVRV